MKKLSLKLDALEVATFAAEGRAEARKGTVQGRESYIDSADGVCGSYYCPGDSGLYHSCVWTCQACSNYASCTSIDC